MKRTTCLQVLAVFLGVAILSAGVVDGLVRVSRGTTAQETALRQLYAPPVVLIQSPLTGTSAASGSAVFVSLSVQDGHPIDHVELWLDGSLLDQQKAGVAATPALYFTFSAIMPAVQPGQDNVHTLLVRAVNQQGVIGESLPVYITVQPGQQPKQLEVPVQPGDTLAKIAGVLGVSMQEIRLANPGVTDPPKPGTAIQVPYKPANPGPEAPAGSGGPGGPAGGQNLPLGPLPTPKVPEMDEVASVNPNLHIFLNQASSPPDAPTNLKASTDGCQVTLVWNDNALNEATYEIYLQANGYGNVKIATLQSSNSQGPAWYRFPAPFPGPISFWVQAVNAIGSSKSNYADVTVNGSCPDTFGSQLQIEAVDFQTSVVSKYYCYVSIDNTPAFRVPAQEGTFIQVGLGSAKIADYAAGANKIVIPQPTVKGGFKAAIKCLGWSLDQNSLVEMGYKEQNFPPSTWDGSDQLIMLNLATVTVRIQPLKKDSAPPPGQYGFNNPTLPVPFNLTQARVHESWSDEWEYEEWLMARNLKWEWNGDPAKISGFRVFLNGKPYHDVALKYKDAYVYLPSSCGVHPVWQVATYGPAGQSQLSAPLGEALPDCYKTVVAQVTFVQLWLGDTKDGLWSWEAHYCDTLQTRIHLYVNNTVRDYGGGNSFIDVSCDETITMDAYFSGDALRNYGSIGKPGVLVSQLNVPEERGNFSPQPLHITFGAQLWDYDDESPEDLVASFEQHFYASSYDMIDKGYFGEGECHASTPQDTTEARRTSWLWCLKFYDLK
jgi:LysM repeat protein